MKIKRIFNFICFFIITPIVAFFTVFIPVIIIGESKSFSFLDLLWPIFGIVGLWIWLILAYGYLIKMFD